jgi:hypothetical protein
MSAASQKTLLQASSKIEGLRVLHFAGTYEVSLSLMCADLTELRRVLGSVH